MEFTQTTIGTIMIHFFAAQVFISDIIGIHLTILTIVILLIIMGIITDIMDMDTINIMGYITYRIPIEIIMLT